MDNRLIFLYLNKLKWSDEGGYGELVIGRTSPSIKVADLGKSGSVLNTEM